MVTTNGLKLNLNLVTYAVESYLHCRRPQLPHRRRLAHRRHLFGTTNLHCHYLPAMRSREANVQGKKTQFSEGKIFSLDKVKVPINKCRMGQRKGCVTTTDGWRDNQKVEKFYVFRHKPPSLKMSDLWDDVFPNMVATGKNVVAPSMNMGSVP
ncbi:hypothetical protein V2J09_013666 [Rumex salicifolius]